MTKPRRAALTFVLLLSSCARPQPRSFPGGLELSGSDGRRHDLSAEIARSKLSVFVFFVEDCPCFEAHEPRLKEWAKRLEKDGVRFYVVDSEARASQAKSEREAQKRGYPFPLLADTEGRLARAFDVEFATHAVVVDAEGRVRYSGALDSDKVLLHTGAKLYLPENLEDLLEGRPPRHPKTEPMGCTLERS